MPAARATGSAAGPGTSPQVTSARARSRRAASACAVASLARHVAIGIQTSDLRCVYHSPLSRRFGAGEVELLTPIRSNCEEPKDIARVHHPLAAGLSTTASGRGGLVSGGGGAGIADTGDDVGAPLGGLCLTRECRGRARSSPSRSSCRIRAGVMARCLPSSLAHRNAAAASRIIAAGRM
jgi:hypothetical protein